jgi:nucleoside-diphosphate-sugar epimerase
MAKATRFPFPGSGEGRACLAYLDDVVRGHLLAMEKGRRGERYILGGVNISVRDIVSLVATMRGKPIRFVEVPFAISRLTAMFEELKGRLFGGKVRITRKGLEAYQHDWAYSSEKSVRELGYTITPLREGLAKTMRWLTSARLA